MPSAIGTVERAERLDEPDPDGWTRLRMRMDWPDEVPGRLLAAGDVVEVLDPPELRARIARRAATVLALYETDLVPATPVVTRPGRGAPS